MNRKTMAIHAAALLTFAGAPQLSSAQTPGALVEGRDFTLLSPAQPTSSPSDQVEVAEVFMFGCVHCFRFEPHWQVWEKRKAEYVNVVKLPTSWNELQRLHAQAFYTAQMLGKLERMSEDLFQELHVKRSRIDTREKLREFFGRYGVDAATFDETFESPTVHAKVERADELIRGYEVTGTPSVVVNGKYLTSGAMARSYEAWFEIIDALVARERAAMAQRENGARNAAGPP